ncbi:MAG: hypothetical protein ACR2JU_01675 [Nocardioidaceae bacterium]
MLTDTTERIDANLRLLGSRHFVDEDYDGHVFDFVPVILGERAPPSRTRGALAAAHSLRCGRTLLIGERPPTTVGRSSLKELDRAVRPCRYAYLRRARDRSRVLSRRVLARRSPVLRPRSTPLPSA